MNEIEKKSVLENDTSMLCERAQEQPGTSSVPLGRGLLDSMSYVEDSIKHIHGLMHGLKIGYKTPEPASSVPQAIALIENFNGNAAVVQAACNCASEIRHLFRAQMDGIATLANLEGGY